jgi:hypothetical protein
MDNDLRSALSDVKKLTISGREKNNKIFFMSGGEFWAMVLAYRILWLHGRFGGGKTSLAAILAARLMAEGYTDKTWSNIPMTFATTPAPPYNHVGIVLDEAWLYLETRNDVKDYAAFVRKFEHFLFLPGIFPVHARLSFFRVCRVFNGYTLGFPFWWYTWHIKSGDVKESGHFGIWNPKSIFGHYPTGFVPGTDGGIGDEIVKGAKAAGYVGSRSEQKREKLLSSFEGDSFFNSAVSESSLDEITASLDDSTFSVSESVDSIQEAIKKAKRFK